MKKVLTHFKKICILLVFALCTNAVMAITYTAVASGSWSDGSTWGGIAPGNNIALDDIVIPAGIDVTFDQDIAFTGLLSSLKVDGLLKSTNAAKLTISNGSIMGSGAMEMDVIVFSSVGSMTYSGSLMANTLIVSAFGLPIAGTVEIAKSLELTAGSIVLQTGATLKIKADANIKIDDGMIDVQGGGINFASSYNVEYVGSSKATGIELSGTDLNNIAINLNDNTQTLSLGNTLIVKGKLDHKSGALDLNNKNLTIQGDYSAAANAAIISNENSAITITSSATLSSALGFRSGSNHVKRIDVNMSSSSNYVDINSDVVVHEGIQVRKGNLRVADSVSIELAASTSMQPLIEVDEGKFIAENGMFIASGTYNVNYTGGTKDAGVELTGLGLNHLTINLDTSNAVLILTSNTKTKGTLAINKGMLNLNGKNLNIAGSVTTTSSTILLVGNTASQLNISGATAPSAPLQFAPGSQMLNTLVINLDDSSTVRLMSDLTLQNLNLTKGSLLVQDNVITFNTNGAISGQTKDKYIKINGNGGVVMDVNNSGFTNFAVGTPTSYSPAQLMMNSTTAAKIKVNTTNQVWSNGTSGVDYTQNRAVVKRTWNISNTSATSVDMNMKLEWMASAEASNFNKTAAYISHYTNGSWDVVAKSNATATTNGTFQLTRNNITSLSPFAVGNDLGAAATAVIMPELADDQVYPNPVKDIVSYKNNTGKASSVGVYDITGKLIFMKETSTELGTQDTIDFDLSGLPAGVYFIKVNAENAQFTKKIIKS